MRVKTKDDGVVVGVFTHEEYQKWVELTITLTPEDIRSLQVSAHIGGDSSGIIEHIVQLAKDKQTTQYLRNTFNEGE